MAIMQLQAGESSTAKIQESNPEKFLPLRKRRTSAKIIVFMIHRVWWQTKSYAIILGVMLLLLASLLFVYLYWFSQKLLTMPIKKAMKNLG
ncbi:MAG: hypothetical protein PUP93_04690 [Rhizonema sp. NSF051]|nr:hypothetical protein [Rhizonema sp. NSF051]